jgi:hypothetical protein
MGIGLVVYSGRDSMDQGRKKSLVFIPLVLALLVAGSNIFAQAAEQVAAPVAETTETPQRPKLNNATMCERVDNLLPTRPGIAFSVSNGQVCCFTSFDPVPQAALVYHRWYHRDELSTQTRLRVYPPKWATYSVIQLRETDKGPWRVEVTDQNGRVFNVLRFSITD